LGRPSYNSCVPTNKAWDTIFRFELARFEGSGPIHGPAVLLASGEFVVIGGQSMRVRIADVPGVLRSGTLIRLLVCMCSAFPGLGEAREESGNGNAEWDREYLGQAVCAGCHRIETEHWTDTIHADVFLRNPRTSLERLIVLDSPSHSVSVSRGGQSSLGERPLLRGSILRLTGLTSPISGSAEAGGAIPRRLIPIRYATGRGAQMGHIAQLVRFHIDGGSFAGCDLTGLPAMS
jgi:hypothetical protein